MHAQSAGIEQNGSMAIRESRDSCGARRGWPLYRRQLWQRDTVSGAKPKRALISKARLAARFRVRNPSSLVSSTRPPSSRSKAAVRVLLRRNILGLPRGRREVGSADSRVGPHVGPQVGPASVTVSALRRFGPTSASSPYVRSGPVTQRL